MFLRGLNKEEKSAFYALAKQLAFADQIYDRSEEMLMGQFLDEMDLTEDEIEVMTANAAIEIFESSSLEVRKQVYIELLGLSLADNNLAEDEEKALKAIAEGFGLSEETADKLAKCVDELFAVYQKIGELIAEQE